MLTAEHLGSSDLPGRWAGRNQFVVLATSFGLADHFLATWAAWRADPQRCRTLHFIAIDPRPPGADLLGRAPRESSLAPLAAQLVAAWPALTPNIHRLEFEGGRLQLLLAINEPGSGLRELVAGVDAFFIDQPNADPQHRAWQPRLFKRLARLAAPGATVSSASTDPELAGGLRAAGFVVAISQPADGNAAPALSARFAPRFAPRRPPARRPNTLSPGRHVVILGAGLAGCASAAALVDQGCAVTLLDRHQTPAAEASGNIGGVFHGVVHAHDGHHARFNRAAALEAGSVFRQMLAGAATGSFAPGSVDGLLRLGSKLADRLAMQTVLDKLGLPPDFVQAVDAEQASILAGIPVAEAAWFYPSGGWMRPAWLANCWLERAASACHFIGGVEVDAIRHIDGQWVLFDRDAAPIIAAERLLLANAGGAQRLLDGLAKTPIIWPLQQVRGQSSQLGLHAGMRAPDLPLSGAGYVLPAVDGTLLFGATAQPGDDCAAVRADDHRENVQRLGQLSPSLAAAGRLPDTAFAGRTAWRCVASDRLPLIGAVPDAWAGGDGGDWDQPRFVPRQPGLFMFTALGSRGITWSPLGAQVLAAMMTGAPVPLEASLLDAIDPARFLSRANRRKAGDQAAPACGNICKT